MVLVLPAEVAAGSRRFHKVAFAIVCLGAISACDPSYAINVRNESSQRVIVGRLLVPGDGDATWDAVEVAPTSTVMI